MKTVRSTTKEYNAIVKTLSDQKFGHKGQKNCYTCTECGHTTKTIDIDGGTTPMSIQCTVKNCQGQAFSSWYKDIAPEQKVTHEWYFPTLEETLKLRKKPNLLDHVLQGGLKFREIKQQTDGVS